MKTTLELPDEMYREAKTLAARKNVKMKDLIARGLHLALEEEKSRSRYPSPLETFSLVREAPLHSAEDIRAAIERVDRDRKMAWGERDGSP